MKIATIGAGQIFTTVYLPVIEKSSNIELAAIVDPYYQGESSCNIYDNYQTMFDNEQIDCVLVLTPNKFHAEIVKYALNKNVHVICEKPPAIVAQDALDNANLAKEKGLFLFYNFHMRQMTQISRIKEMLNTEEYGPVYKIDIVANRRRGVPGWGNFINLDMQGGGPLIDLGIHYLDIINHLFSDISYENIIASSSNIIGTTENNGDFGAWDSEKFEVENYISAYIKTNKNFAISLETSFAHNIVEPNDYRIDIYTQNAKISVLDGKVFNIKEQEINEINLDFELNSDEVRMKSINLMLQSIAKNEMAVSLCSGDDGYKIQEVIEKIYKEAE